MRTKIKVMAETSLEVATTVVAVVTMLTTSHLRVEETNLLILRTPGMLVVTAEAVLILMKSQNISLKRGMPLGDQLTTTTAVTRSKLNRVPINEIISINKVITSGITTMVEKLVEATNSNAAEEMAEATTIISLLSPMRMRLINK